MFEPVPVSGWSLQNAFMLDDIPVDVDELRRQLIWIVVLTLLLCIGLTALVLKATKGKTTAAWVISTLISLLLFIGIGVHWHLALTYHESERQAGIRVLDKDTLRALVEDYRQHRMDKHRELPNFIPTGVYIETMELPGANDVLVTGRIWQKYAKDFAGEIGQGFVIGRAKNVKISEIEARVMDRRKIVVWRFGASLRSELDYAKYPFEAEKIRLVSVLLLPTSIDISRVLGICVSVFFVVAFSHLAIRRNIAGGEIFYLEYFLLVMYLASEKLYRDRMESRDRLQQRLDAKRAEKGRTQTDLAE
jgi:hypothetical protein